MEKITMKAKTVEPNDYSVWAVDRETKELVEFEVQAFTVKEALEIARKAYTEKHKQGLRIRVCVESGEKYEQAKVDWVERLEANKIKNNARNIGKVKELMEIITDDKTLDKVLEIVGLTEFKEYLDNEQ